MEERGQVAATLQMIKAIFCRGFLAKTRRACIKIQGGLEAKLLRFPCDGEDEKEEDDEPVDDYGIDEQDNNDLEEDVAAIEEVEDDESDQSYGHWLVGGEVLEKDEIRDKDWSNEEEEKEEEEESFAEGNAGDLCENCQVEFYWVSQPKIETIFFLKKCFSRWTTTTLAQRTSPRPSRRPGARRHRQRAAWYFFKPHIYNLNMYGNRDEQQPLFSGGCQGKDSPDCGAGGSGVSGLHRGRNFRMLLCFKVFSLVSHKNGESNFFLKKYQVLPEAA